MLLFSQRGLCPFCEAHKLLRRGPTATPYRSLTTLQHKKPSSRLTLSPNVSTPVAPRKSKASPFGAMNRTHPGAALRRDQQRRAAITRNPIPRGTPTQRKKGKVQRASGDMKALRMQASLATVNYARRTDVKTRISDRSIQSFDVFGLREDVRQGLGEVLEGMVDVTPTPVQRLAIPALLGWGDYKGRRGAVRPRKGMESFLIAAETGSGKTLAYALPILHQLKELEAEEHLTPQQESFNPLQPRGKYELQPPPLSSDLAPQAQPKAIILLPSAELVSQVGRIFKTFTHTAKQRVAVVSAAHSAKVIRSRLTDPDIVISTPALLASVAETTPSILSAVRYLVADEADSLFDRSFAPLTSSIVDRASPSLHQLILCSATIPRALDAYLRKRFPDITRLTTPNLHAIPRHVQLSVLDIAKDPYRGNRDLACADAIWRLGKESHAAGDGPASTELVLVFVNERNTAGTLAEYLRSKGIDAVPLTRDTGSTATRSADLLEAFTTRRRAEVADAEVGAVVAEGGRTLPGVRVLIATDLASRGLDTVGVRTVMLYDVPHSSIDFVHRLGRTGRMGRRGRGIVLVGNDDRRDVVREVKEGMFMGRALI